MTTGTALRPTDARSRGGFLPLAALLGACVAVYIVSTADAGDYRRMAIGSGLTASICVFAVLRRWGNDLLRAPVLYLVLFAVFHLGLVWTLGAFGEEAVVAVSSTALYWIRSPYFALAVTLSCAAIVVFTLVTALLAPKTARLAAGGIGDTGLPGAGQRLIGQRYGRVGLALQLFGLVLVLRAVLGSGGLELLFGGYLAFLESAETATLGYGIWAIGLGSCLSQLGTTASRRAGLAVFCAFAIVMFPLGLRGSVLFPAAVLVSTRAMLGWRIRPGVLMLTGLGVLSLAAVVRHTRIGQSVQSEGLWYVGPLSTVTELGFSLRPVVEVLAWRDAGLPPTRFVSIIAVPLRFIEGITGLNGGAPAVDDRLFNVKIQRLVGPVGGSPVAEGFDALGTAGVVLVVAVLAAVVSALARKTAITASRAAVYPAVLLPVLIAVRNSFAPVVVQVAMGLTVVLVVQLSSTDGSAEPDERGHAP